MRHYIPQQTLLLAAAAIANERGGRRGVPPFENILDLVGPKLTAEVLADSQAVFDALKLPKVLEALQLVREHAFNRKWPKDEETLAAVNAALAALDPDWRASW